jgi:Zn-dependent peptidase ImmA (M78 family)
LLAFRRVRKYQHLLIEIYGQEYFENKYRWLKEYNLTLTDAPEFDQLAYWLREKLEFPFEDQVKEKSNDTAYKRWRESFENKLGVFSFQFSLPTDETQGFSYSDTVPFCIAINSNGYGANSRTFTLFHELAHLLQRQSGICVPDRVAKDQHIEYQINEFTGAVLIPKDRATRIIDPDKIYMTAKRFKVSSEVYVRRMHSLQLISQEEFFHLLEIIKKRVRTLKKGAFAGSPVQKCIAAKGQLFYDSVVTAAKNGLLSYSQASEALELKVNHFISV